jgi:hypothetical protein
MRPGTGLVHAPVLTLVSLASLLVSFSAEAQEISLRRGGEPARLAPGHAIIVGGVQYVGRDAGRCKLWISDGGDFRSSGCDVIPDERPLSERLADAWEERPVVVAAVPVAVSILAVGTIVMIARRRARRAREQSDSPAPA